MAVKPKIKMAKQPKPATKKALADWEKVYAARQMEEFERLRTRMDLISLRVFGYGKENAGKTMTEMDIAASEFAKTWDSLSKLFREPW